VSSSLGYAQDGLRSCTVLSCTVIIHIQPPCFRLTRYRCRVMACAGRYHAVKCDHHHLLPPMHLEHSSSQLLSPAQIGRDQMTWCPAYLRSASPMCLVVQSFFQAVLLGQHDRMQDSEDMLLLDDCLSWFFFFKILVDFDTPGKQNKALCFPLSIRYLSTNLTYPHIQSYSPHAPRKALTHALRILGRDLHHRCYASKKHKRNQKRKKRKERKKRKKTQFTDPLYSPSPPPPFPRNRKGTKTVAHLHHTTEANVT
jgi:hypothetical protein